MSTEILTALLIAMLPVLGVLLYIGQRLGRIGNAMKEMTEAYGRSRTTPLLTTDGEPAPAAPSPNDALRLQACERLTLMLERINVPNLLLRIPPVAGGTSAEYTAALLLNIRQEFEYNVSQQIYVSDQLWSIVLAARENVSQLIARAAEGADTAEQLAGRLRLMSARQPENAIAVGQAAVRREASLIVG